MINIQKDILTYLKQGGRLTVKTAIMMFHTTEFRKIVSRLRELGHRIGSTWRTDQTSDGRQVRFKEYYLIAE
jgi:hypothetical protein